ncbi:YdbH family protein [Erwinia sp. ErVv1]|uniref:YdbH family protein n=1 Tax=Erwinia sp. ErVv1 TaxID=1603299 RepID=UPI000835811A|nr:YdbH family protein [Erwinia sp. ErVv1]
MTRGWKILTAAVMSVVLLLAGLMLTITHWLPRLAGVWLPAGTSVALDGRPGWHKGALSLPGIRYLAGQCVLANVRDVSLSKRKGRWLLDAADVNIDSACFDRLPNGKSEAAPRTLAAWQAMLPSAQVSVDHFSIAPWQNLAGALRLSLDSDRQQITYSGDALSLKARLEGDRLNVDALTFQAPGIPEPVQLSGTLHLPVIPNTLPEEGQLGANLTLQGVPDPLTVRLNWQQQQGELLVTAKDNQTPLVSLPWQVSADSVQITHGQWRWPWASQPLSGGVALSLNHWQQGLAATEITGRLNVLTQGRGGKGNVVLTLGPGHLDLVNSALPFRITGESKLAQLQFYAGLPGEVRGPLLDPALWLSPGALLRMRGRLLPTLEVDEARWPLAGVTLSSAGVDGRLQAILSAHDPQMGRFRLHLDGRATGFWPDKGLWQWRYWGNGKMVPLSASWDVNGNGRWQETLIELTSLSTGFDRIRYGGVNVHAPRLTLTSPLRWDRAKPSFDGALSLTARQTLFGDGGYLPPATLALNVSGRDPASFLYRGTLQAQAIGPVRLQGRWDGAHLRGQAWWPTQPLTVFQPLLSNDLKMKIRSGTLRAQVAFSAASDSGLEAGGHWVVSNGSVSLPDNDISGVDFSLPFRLKVDRWYFGAKGPVSLRIKAIKNQFTLQNITADLQGGYPWSEEQPLRLSNVGMDILGGTLRMESLQMPQHEAATLRIKNISVSELVTAIKPKQIAMSGHINGALPLWLSHPRWLIKDGWIANSGPLTVRMDKDFADTISNNNIAAGAAMNWLRYMEISRSWATLDLDNLGMMTFRAQVNGTSRFSDKNQRVSLNYTQQENLFQLWRSLRFGDNVQSWLEDNATLPKHKEKSDETH